jgi:hypothetical protein
MQLNSADSDLLAIKIGFWSALSIAITFIVFTFCFIMIYSSGPQSAWTNIQDFAVNVSQGNRTFKYLAQGSMALFGPLYLIFLNCLHALVPPSKKILTRLAANFGLAFAVLSSMHYFVQITSVPWNVAKGQLIGLDQFVQSNPSSFILSANMLGWTFFFGLSSLFAAFAFSNSGLERWMRIALMLNGITCLVGGVGFILQNVLLIFITMNFLMGGFILAFSIIACLWCRNLMV